MHEGNVSTRLGLKGIPTLAEEMMVDRDISICEYTNSRFHLSYLSTKKSAEKVKKAKAKGIEIHTRSAFLQGLFFKNTSELTIKIKPLEPYLNLLNDLCDEDYKMNDLALNYVCNQKNIDKVLSNIKT